MDRQVRINVSFNIEWKIPVGKRYSLTVPPIGNPFSPNVLRSGLEG